jgi:hypothetical protein
MPIAGKNHHGGTSPHPTITAAEITTRNGLIKKWARYAPDVVPPEITDGLKQIDTKIVLARSADPAALAEKLTILVEMLEQEEHLFSWALAQSCQRDAALLAGGVA